MYKSGSTSLSVRLGASYFTSLSLSAPNSKMDKSTSIKWSRWAFWEVICHILTQPLTHTTVMAFTMITRKRQAPQASPSEGPALGLPVTQGKCLPPLSMALTAFKGATHLEHCFGVGQQVRKHDLTTLWKQNLQQGA